VPTGAAGSLGACCADCEPLGDVLCLEGDCKVGEQLVREMQAVFRQLGGVGKDELDDSDVAFMRRFGPAVTSIVEQFNGEQSKLSRQVPFSLVCCSVKDLGVKAQSLTTQMRTFRDVAQPSTTPIDSPFKPGPAGIDLGGLATIVALALGGAILIPALARSSGGR